MISALSVFLLRRQRNAPNKVLELFVLPIRPRETRQVYPAKIAGCSQQLLSLRLEIGTVPFLPAGKAFFSRHPNRIRLCGFFLRFQERIWLGSLNRNSPTPSMMLLPAFQASETSINRNRRKPFFRRIFSKAFAASVL